MISRCKLSVILLLFFALLFPNEKVKLSHLGNDFGLMYNTFNINGLYQDENGVMWIGTKEGVKRFNGNTIESFRVTGPNNWHSTSLIPTVCGDQNGRVFFNSDYQIIEYNMKLDETKIIFEQKNILALPSLTFNYGNQSLWIGIKDTILNYRDNKLMRFTVLSDNKAEISAIKELTDGTIIAGTKHSGLFAISKSKTQQKIVNIGSEVISIYEDSQQRIWVGTMNDGVFVIDKNEKVTQYTQFSLFPEYRISSNYVRAVCEDDDGNFWIGTMKGLDLISESTSTISHFGLSGNGKQGLANLSVWIIIKDDQGTIWFGTYYGGLDYYNPSVNIFKTADLKFNAKNSVNIVSKIVEDKRGTLWISTEGNGLIAYRPENNEYKSFTKENSKIPHNNVKSLYYDEMDDKLWIGTHLGGLSCYDIEKKVFTNYTVNKDSRNFRSEIIHAIAKHENLIFLGTLAGVYYLNTDNNEIFKLYSLDNYLSTVDDMLIDSDYNLWIAGNNLCKYDIKNRRVQSFEKELNKLFKTNKYQLTALFESRNKNIVIASAGFGALIFKPQSSEFLQYTSQNSGLTSDYLNCISEMSNSNILFGSNMGLSCLDLDKQISFNFDNKTGLPLLSMMPGDIFKSDNGDFFLGGANGIASFKEKDLFSNSLPVKIYFSKLSVNNKEVRSSTNKGIIASSINYTDIINLKHDENNIAIEIGTNNFVKFGNTKYQYKLEGFKDEWIDFSPELPIQYMNLPYGKYKLIVKAYQIQNLSDKNEISVLIRVYPPWYASWIAKIVYLLLFLGISAWIIFFYKSRLMLRTTLEAEHREKIRIEQINETKMRFFANISHELRTPLTIIIGQLELLLTQRFIPTVIKSLTEIHTGANKMSKLINELLDFLKYSHGDLKLKVSNQDIIMLIKEEYDSFLSYVTIKEIDFHYEISDEPVYLYFDKLQMQKVFSNLFSNAIKYTHPKGCVSVSVEQSSDSVRIKIEDSGVGISEDVQDKIFERFYQEENEINRDIATTGTGIGLSLANNIVVAHGGKIYVDSQIGKGSIFTVELPKGTEHLEKLDNIEIMDDSNIINNSVSEFSIEEHQGFIDDILEQQKSNFSSTTSILIVEDDEVIRKLLVRIFEPLFNVFEAENGDVGLIIAREKSPDLILSDVMMPKMSGKTLCSIIKSDFDTCHIPVVLLTALSGVDDNISGLISGADAYITKPFNIKILVTECIGILNNRRRLQDKFRNTDTFSSSQLASNPMDQQFVEKTIHIIENSLESGTVDIGLLCSELGISRTKLFLKMKGITGLTPHEFIQNTKLKFAAKMLREKPEYNISDIAFNLGFSSLNYFGKSFKEFFGESPSAYRKKYFA